MIVILDLDGTIIGDIAPQVCEYELLCEHCPAKLKLLREFLLSQLRHSCIIRPHFREFMHGMRAMGVDTFVYTASESKWANFVVPLIEKAVGVKFGRPLFTRKDCRLVNGEYRKPTRGVLQAVVRKRQCSVGDVRDRVVFLDNANVILQDSPTHVPLVLCPTYSRTCHHDVTRFLTQDVLRRDPGAVVQKLVLYKMIQPVDQAVVLSAGRIQVLVLQQLLRHMARDAVRAAEPVDSMWLKLRRLLGHPKLRGFDARTVGYLNAKLRAS